jgi:hypothetical protein
VPSVRRVEPLQLLWCRLERVGRLGRHADDEPELIAVGVVEQLPDHAWFDEQAAERLERMQIWADPNATGAVE